MLFKNEKNNEGDSNASGDSTPTEHALHNCCVYLRILLDFRASENVLNYNIQSFVTIKHYLNEAFET